MKMSMNAFLFSLLTSTSFVVVVDGISITQSPSVADLVNTFIGSAAGITLEGTSFSGPASCAGIFTGGHAAVNNGNFPDEGIILSTGSPSSLSMQNGGAQSLCHGTGGDTDLNNLSGQSTQDACVLNIQFSVADVATTPNIAFQYVFGSDEYVEYANSSFNDVFALFLNGQNIATLPASTTAVSINNVNNVNNPGYFYRNDQSPAVYPGFEADGFTALFTAIGDIQPGTNTLKLAIADASDCAFDSWVLIEADSFQVVDPTDPGMSMDPHVKTWTGEMFDYMGECDLVLLDSPSFQNGLGLHVDVRTTIRYDYSFIESAVLQIGEHKLEVASFGEFALNGVDTPELEEGSASLAGHQFYHTQVNKKVNVFDVVLSPTTNITLSTYKDMVSIKVTGDRTILGDCVGMIGSSVTGEMLSRDGKIRDAFSSQDAINAFGQEWQIAADEPMRFRTTRSPQASKGEKCALPSVTAKQSLRRRLEGGSISLEQAKEACAHLSGMRMDACVGDVLALQDLEAAQAGAY